MQEFRQTREKIDSLIDEAKSAIQKKSISDSMDRIEQAQALLLKLKKLAGDAIQNRIVINRSCALEVLARRADDILSKREAGKKEDGNIAFKCNWNDKHYQAPCSPTAYAHNLAEGRAWCSLPENECRKFSDASVSLSNHPCYESIALKEMYFAAGWDKTEERNQPRHIHSARKGRMAILTTRPPGSEEKDRLIVGCLFIDKIIEDPGKETQIFGDREKSIKIDYDTVKLYFWNYYKNAGDENLKLWASGLFRYITDETVLNILKGLGEQYRNTNRDVSKIISLIRHYEGLVNRKSRSSRLA